eukprot:9279011-Pyramimonas_sp.AAC.1
MAIVAPACAARVHMQTHSDLSRSSQDPHSEFGPSAEYVVHARHTPAHRSAEVIDSLPPAERRIARANEMADRFAKHALEMHARESPGDLEQLDAL